MKTLEVGEEFKRKLFAPGFFTQDQMTPIYAALNELDTQGSLNIDYLYKTFIVKQSLKYFLENKQFSPDLAEQIKMKVNTLKKSVFQNAKLKETSHYSIQQAYSEFKHFIILGHPGSGKTSISKWLVTCMAKQMLGQENTLFDRTLSLFKEKLPILIPVWKYFEKKSADTSTHQQMTLLQFICEYATLDSQLLQDPNNGKQLNSLFLN